MRSGLSRCFFVGTLGAAGVGSVGCVASVNEAVPDAQASSLHTKLSSTDAHAIA
jgi:hypothetical protein